MPRLYPKIRRSCTRKAYALALAGLTVSATLPLRAEANAFRVGSRFSRSRSGEVWNTARVPKFSRVATFDVADNAPARNIEAVAEIVVTNDSGDLLVYTDGKQKALGFVDISDDALSSTGPRAEGLFPLDGEPTSVAVVGNYALAAVNTSESFVNPSGELVVIDLNQRNVEGYQPQKIPLAGQPDSIAVDPQQRYVAIVIENERDEDIEVDGVEGGLPQAPAGLLQKLSLVDGVPDADSLVSISLSGLEGMYAPEDPEPEYVDINDAGLAVVTLQENNHLVVVDLNTDRIVSHFPAGTVNLKKVDTVEEDLPNITPVNELRNLARQPDAVTWLNDHQFATANEGDLSFEKDGVEVKGGSRGFSVFNKNGRLAYDSGNRFEHLAISIGHYPEHRSENKGTEPEGIASGRFRGGKLLFVGSERGNFVGVYRPRRYSRSMDLVQVLPGTGVGPEGLLPIPQRGLFVIANEKSDATDDADVPGNNRFHSTISIFRQGHRSYARPQYPQIASASVRGTPIAWSALSGLTAAPFDWFNWGRMWAVGDSALNPASIFAINTRRFPAQITERILVKDRDGTPLNLDLEGIARRDNGGFVLASEGKAAGGELVNELLVVNRRGRVRQHIPLPEDLAATARKHGFEGVTVSYQYNQGRRTEVYTAVIQRSWTEDAGTTLIARYVPRTGQWTFFGYPLESVDEGWVGLSEITYLENNQYAVIERDNLQGPGAAIKRVYKVELPMGAGSSDWQNPTMVSKELFYDLIPDLTARNGWIPDKVEGMALDAFGNFTFVSDNDGVDDAVGETYFWSPYLNAYHGN